MANSTNESTNESAEHFVTHLNRLNNLIGQMNSVLMSPLLCMSVIEQGFRKTDRIEDAELIASDAGKLSDYIVQLFETIQDIAKDAELAQLENVLFLSKTLREMEKK